MDEDNEETERHPLIALLSLTPTQALNNMPFTLHYVDFMALETATGVNRPANLQSAPESGPWIDAMQRLALGPQYLNYLIYSEEARNEVGFALLDIDRALTFGEPPSVGLILGGDPDVLTNYNAIDAAFSARGFTALAVREVTVWQRRDRNSLETNLSQRNPANPFGGHLGRQEPAAMLPGFVMNSADPDVMDTLIVTAAQGNPSVLETSPDIAALADVIMGSGEQVLQVMFVKPQDIAALSITETAAANLTALPPYEIAALVDLQIRDEVVHVITVAYRDIDQAIFAADEISRRLTDHPQNDEAVNLIDLLGATIESEVYTSEEHDRSIAFVSMRYPFSDEGPSAFGTGFRMWVRDFYNDNFMPIFLTTTDKAE